ncbi:hypothetical protein [Herbaspirillum sp.]|uniref:hypothetical protein n=1 Tax=Herbaspirillum sp. TaxID=1890675 RepID=UPI0031E293FC
MGVAESLRSDCPTDPFFLPPQRLVRSGLRVRLAFGIAVLSLACGIDAVARYLAIAVILTKVRIQRR